MTDPDETADEARLRRLREAIGSAVAADISEEQQLEAVLRLLVGDPSLVERLHGFSDQP